MQYISFLNKPDFFHPFLVVEKAAGVPSAPLFEGDFSALTLAQNAFPEIKNVRGKKEVEHGLIHRIDTETSGLVLIALTQDFYDFMIQEQAENRFEKFYRAQVDFSPDIFEKLEGFPKNPFLIEEIEAAVKNQKVLELESFFRKFGKGGKEVRPVLENGGMAAKKKSSGKMYRTQIKFLDKTHVEAKITQGFRHQVRCHLAWIGFPVQGDEIYNPKCREKDCRGKPDNDKKGKSDNDRNNKNGNGRESKFKNELESNDAKQRMKFEAWKIKFKNPMTNENEVFEI